MRLKLPDKEELERGTREYMRKVVIKAFFSRRERLKAWLLRRELCEGANEA